MYNELISEFKKELIDRRLDKFIISSFTVLFIVYMVATTVLCYFYQYWVVILLSNLALIFLCLIVAYSIIFIIVKNKNNFVAKDYFHFIRVIKSLSKVIKRDVEILLPLIKSYGIDTRPKVQEAIKHYQQLLLRKSKNGFAVISIISLSLSIFGIVFSAVNIQSNKELFILIMLLFCLVIGVTFVCFTVKLIYKSTYYNLSEYALYERIETTLSEIWMKKLI